MAEAAENLTEPASASDSGGQHAGSLFPSVYEDLRRFAHRLFQRQNASAKTLQPTAVVHEAFLRLAQTEAGSEDPRQWADRTHFFATAARAVRMVLTDYARERSAAKRGGGPQGWHRVTLELADVGAENRTVDLLALNEAMERLTELDDRQAKLVELRLFAGLTMEEIARDLGVSLSTVESDWRMARAWLNVALRDGD